MNLRGTNPNSLANLKAEKRWIDKSLTTTIRVPESLKPMILEFAHMVDNIKNNNPDLFENLINDELGILPKRLTYNKIEQIIGQKKSMYVSIRKLELFLSSYMPRTEEYPMIIERHVNLLD